MRRAWRTARALPSETGVVAALSHDGAGIVHAGKTAFVAGALPGETVRFRGDAPHRQHDEARAGGSPRARAERVSRAARTSMICGGCALQHLEQRRAAAPEGAAAARHSRAPGAAEPARWLAARDRSALGLSAPRAPRRASTCDAQGARAGRLSRAQLEPDRVPSSAARCSRHRSTL